MVQLSLTVVDLTGGRRRHLAVSRVHELPLILDTLAPRFGVDPWERLLLASDGSGETVVERLGRTWRLTAGKSVVLLDQDIVRHAGSRYAIRILGSWHISQETPRWKLSFGRTTGTALLAGFLGASMPALAAHADAAQTHFQPHKTNKASHVATTTATVKGEFLPGEATAPGFGAIKGQVNWVSPGARPVDGLNVRVVLVVDGGAERVTGLDENWGFAFAEVPAGGPYELRIEFPAGVEIHSGGFAFTGPGGHELQGDGGGIVAASVDVRAGATTEAVLTIDAQPPSEIVPDVLGGVMIPPPPPDKIWPSELVRRPVAPWGGLVEATSGLSVDFGWGHFGKPLRVPLWVGYGLADRLALGVLTGDGFCMNGGGRCQRVVDQVAAEAIAIPVDRPGGQFAVRVGGGLDDFAAPLGLVRAGFLGKIRGENLALQVEPLAQIAVNHRDRNLDLLRVPVELQGQINKVLAVFARAGFEARWHEPGTRYLVPVGAGALRGDKNFDIGIMLLFPRMAGTGAAPSDFSLLFFVTVRLQTDHYWGRDHSVEQVAQVMEISER